MTKIKKIWSYINQDVENENESKKTSVLMRIFILILLLYLTAQLIFFAAFHNYMPMIISVIAFVVYVVAFAGTYKGKTVQVLIGLQIVSLAWIVASIWMLGWDSGLQQFLLIMLILVLFSGHQRVKQKALLAAIYLCVRIALYVYSINSICMYPLTRQETMILQTINSFAIYAEIASLSVIFAREAQATERKLVSYNRKIEEMAFRDPLTQLRNRRSMLELLQKTTREQNTYICVAIADIDFFKKVNDTYGHEAGDEVLKAVAKQLMTHMHNQGYVARWGGEEFLFLFEDGNGDLVAQQLEDLREKIEKVEVLYNEQKIRFTMTFGLVEYNSNATLEENISLADQKLYSGKEAGRNRVVF